MKKVSAVIRLVLLFICILLILTIRSRHNEGFYDAVGGPLAGPGTGMYAGTYDDPNLYPLAYNMYQSKPQVLPDMGPLGTQRIPVSVPYVPAPPNPVACTGAQNAPSGMYQHPLTYPNQLYPKVPWYPKTGMACVPGECGATSTCYEGYCVPNKTDKTVFNTEIR
jgi:hypothetical protein